MSDTLDGAILHAGIGECERPPGFVRHLSADAMERKGGDERVGRSLLTSANRATP
jgi:hypothetical protein